jgi:hypothetical protein
VHRRRSRVLEGPVAQDPDVYGTLDRSSPRNSR